MSTNDQIDRPRLDQLIEDEFGVNADYVGELFQQFESDPGSVDEEWRAFFKEILANGSAAADGDGPTGTRRSEPGLGKSGPPETVASSAVGAHVQTGPSTAAGGLKESNKPLISSPTSPAADPSSSTTGAMGSVATTPGPVGGHPAQSAASPAAAAISEKTADERIAIKGPALRIAQNMETSLGVPTATSQRQVPVKLLEENRRLINDHLKGRRKVSYTHLIARAILKAI